MFKILQKQEIAPNVHEVVIDAPAVARKVQPGQFIILMVDSESERVPYSLSEWDPKAGTISIVILEVGQSSRKLALCREGDEIEHLVGPLGQPLDTKAIGSVAITAGCYGIGAVIGIARSYREAGNEVTIFSEARSYYMHYYKEKLSAVANELVQTTIDGSLGVQGHATKALRQRLAGGDQFDLVVAIGCPFMMMITSRDTAPHKVQTLVALNPIMLDGTGMCGACRVTVDEKTKFACVDGPFFDGHLVDWDELWDRRAAYDQDEIMALERTDPVDAKPVGTGCGHCGH
jgi:NAD(P)H-flavin reductase